MAGGALALTLRQKSAALIRSRRWTLCVVLMFLLEEVYGDFHVPRRSPIVLVSNSLFKCLFVRPHARLATSQPQYRRTTTIASVCFLPSFRTSVTALARFALPYRAISGAECHPGPRNPYTKGRATPPPPTPPTASSRQARGSQSTRATATSTVTLTSQMATPIIPSLLPLPLPQ